MTVLGILVFVSFLLISVILHELAHGFVSHLLGDPTPKRAGRLSFNPIRHLDPLGTLLPVLLFFLGSRVVIGWAKPVPINPVYYSHRRLGIFLVGLAGPAANFLIALIAVFFLRFASNSGGELLFFLAMLNLALMLFNLLPIPPLDGSRIVQIFLPASWLYPFFMIERAGFTIIFLLIIFFPSGLRYLFVLVQEILNFLVSAI